MKKVHTFTVDPFGHFGEDFFPTIYHLNYLLLRGTPIRIQTNHQSKPLMYRNIILVSNIPQTPTPYP